MHSFEISDRFVKYYRTRGFHLLPGSSLLDPSIPMTFVMSAGLVQVEMSLEKLGQNANNAYVLSQKCFRHFDVGKIGDSDTHLSLFEMPGAFTFWAKDKSVTIQRMWDLVTNSLEVNPDRLWVTYFGGGSKAGHPFPRDVETYRAWKQIGLAEERIVALGPDDNFWMQGGGINGDEPRRKCGPNSEIFYDQGQELRCSPGCRPGCRCGRFIEFANSLFICAEVDEESGIPRPLERPFYETVIGTERVAMILQGKPSVFDIDCMRPLVQKVLSFCPAEHPGPQHQRAARIITDYARALLFLTADGAPPAGKGGRRRIVKLLIRGVLTQQRILGVVNRDFLPEFLDTVIAIYAGEHPGLPQGRDVLLDYFADQQTRFGKTLRRGYDRLDDLIHSSEGLPSTNQIVDLVKRYGLPLPLIAVEFQQRGIRFQRQAYQRALADWQEAHQ